MCVRMYIYIYKRLYACVDVYACSNVPTSLYIHIQVCMCIYTYMNVCTVYTYIYMCIHIHLFTYSCIQHGTTVLVIFKVPSVQLEAGAAALSPERLLRSSSEP